MISRNHVLPLPQWLLVIRGLQLATAIVVLGLAAYGVTYLSFDGIDLTLFTVSFRTPFPRNPESVSKLLPQDPRLQAFCHPEALQTTSSFPPFFAQESDTARPSQQ
jgi:hypothetical protein